MTKEEAIREHRKMWKWIEEETRRRRSCAYKEEYLYKKGYDPYPDQRCFCCEYAYHEMIEHGKLGETNKCKYCPVCWESEAQEYMCEFANDEDIVDCLHTGLYGIWCKDCFEEDWEHAADMAGIIATLAESED